MAKPPDIPDLDLPGAGVPSQKPPTSRSMPARPAPSPSNDDDDLFGGGIERGGGSEPIAPPPGQHRGKAISIDFGGGVPDDDGFGGGGIERGAEMSMPPTSGGRQVVSSRAPASMNLDVAYRRPGAGPAAAAYEPSFLEKAGGRALALVGLAAVLAPLIKYVHHAGAHNIMNLLPHAFDASSTALSGGFAGVALIVSITIGYLGIIARGRSYAMVASGGLFLFTSLAMVTVALVSLEENPSPADGARLIPYLLPAALVLLGLGISGRGQESYLDGGARRALPFACGLAGGLVAYAGIALSAL